MSQFIVKPVLKSLFTNPPAFSAWKNSLLYKLFPNNTLVKHTPVSLVIYTTKRCNFKCEFCFTYDDLNKPDWKSFELTNESFKKILDTKFGRQSLRIGFLGGEPFLNPYLFDFLEESHRYGKITTVVSNASLINENVRHSLLKVSPTMLGLSWYDNNQEQVLFLSRWLAENRKYFWVQTVIASDQINTMHEKLQLAHQNNIKNLIFSNYNPTYSGNIDKVIFENNADFIKLSKDLISLARSLKINLTLPQAIQKNPVKRNCQMPFSYVHLDSKGVLGACCFRSPNAKYGNIHDEDVWNLPAHQELRNTFLNFEKEPLKECRYCENFSRDLYGF